MSTSSASSHRESIVGSEIVPSSLKEIAPILRVADEIESEKPRVAYLCRIYAFKKAQELDPTSRGRNVRQFKTALLKRIGQGNDPTLEVLAEKSDASEMKSFYLGNYISKIQPLQNAADKAHRAQLSKACINGVVLFEVLEAVYNTLSIKIEKEVHILEARNKVKEYMQIYAPYNILPLVPVGANQAISKYPEIQSAVKALCKTEDLPWPNGHEKKRHGDVLDWLQEIFGFQEDNVANQREHLILLLANVHIRRFPRLELQDQVLTEVSDKLFENYEKWYKFLGKTSNLRSPETKAQQRKLLYIGLYLLIWGEAANLRFMPECLCYIFHRMADDVNGRLDDNVSRRNREPAYGGGEEAFLRKVVTPFYQVIAKEADRGKRGRSAHSQWRNYDDLNEYFWSVDCFRFSWPPTAEDSIPAYGDRSVGKVNFVEIRSFWHIFRSFDRMWSFFILCLQAMIIVAWNSSGDPTALFTPDVYKKLLSIFITAAILKLVQAVLDVILSWKAQWSMTSFVKLRYILKVVLAVVWVIILPVTYAHTWANAPGLAQTIKSWFGYHSNSPSLFVLAVVIYLSPNMLAALLFLFPFIGRFLENSKYKIVILMMWWSQPRLYVGRGMHESTFCLFKYTMFWVFLMITKLAFSYYIEIKPLVGPTKAIMSVRVTNFQWHEFFPRAENNIGVVIALWAPVILVYFMDTQIWYAILSTLCGGFCGVVRGLGEVRTLGMLRSRLQSLPDAFNAHLITKEEDETQSNEEKGKAKFAQIWNTIIIGFREEDLISDREKNLLLVPYWADRELEDIIEWPLFLLASKIPMALDMAKDSNSNDQELRKRMETDNYMSSAIRECYAQFRSIIMFLVRGNREKELIKRIFEQVQGHVEEGRLTSRLKMSALPSLHDLFVQLIKFLSVNDPQDSDKVVHLFQDMFELVTRDIMMEDHIRRQEEITRPEQEKVPLFASAGAIRFPIRQERAPQNWKNKIERLHLLLTTKDSAMDVPSNLEARRRICFLTNSLFMKMPAAPKVRNMLSFSVLTPYYDEDVLFSLQKLETENEDGVSILFYLQKIFPDEWTNFLERVKRKSEEEVKRSVELREQLCFWASYRGQTLARTVRGMMYYEKALELQAFLEKADIGERGDKAVELYKDRAKCQEEVDMKFTYVVSCQEYSIHKRSGNQRAQDIERLMKEYPSLRVAYIDEVEEPSGDRPGRINQKTYYSTLMKATFPNTIGSSNSVEKLVQVIYRIKLPGYPILGEGKPENQNHAIIFTRGECLQTIDMNQDNYMEEALKMRNLLEEFHEKHDGVRFPTILGLREHIFTGSVSSLAWFMSNQEASFVTIGQRLLANPLKVRFHYGHPDVFDRLFHLTRGGVSKASKVINLSEDIFVGFNSTLREGNVTHHEYIQVGKGRDVSLNQISMFEAKIANGNGEQTLSRDVYRLGHRFDFFRMLSCYFTTIGFYFNTLICVLTVYVFLYGRLYLVLSGFEKELSTQPIIRDNRPLQVALASQSFVQFGFSMVLPMLMEIGLERGFLNAISDFVMMQLQLASIFFTFSLGIKTHYYGRTLLHGGAKYRGTSRSFGVFHAKFVDNYRMYSRSHFVKGFELMILLLVYQIFGQSHTGAIANILITMYMWFMVGSWLFAPFLFNPSGFEWQKIVDDWRDWKKWISNQGGIVLPEKSWETWWEEEHEHLRHSGTWGIIAETILALRFFIYQYGLVYHLNIVKHNKSFMVYGISWLVIFLILFVIKIVSVYRPKVRANLLHVLRLFKGLIFLAVVTILITLIALQRLTMRDIMVCFLALMPTGWGMLLIAQACKPLLVKYGIWGAVRTLARGYDIIMGFFLFTPVAFLAWFPFVSEFQTRMLFNEAFSRGLQISRLLGGQRKYGLRSSKRNE
ncbi:hypothetical protein ACJRO7_003759 [Eucalyptus globulus]|uniref:1,3-beta-glucan synthase n=1 Tax=Eucalyptus globulus TaxID=34317 RepID=A0ABD3IZP3_EUCGL